MADLHVNRFAGSAAEHSFLGRLPDFPSVSSIAATLLDALSGTINILTDSVSDPDRLSPSALLVLQTSPALRAQLDAEAAEQGISLTQWATRKLAVPARACTAGADQWRLSAYRPRC